MYSVAIWHMAYGKGYIVRRVKIWNGYNVRNEWEDSQYKNFSEDWWIEKQIDTSDVHIADMLFQALCKLGTK